MFNAKSGLKSLVTEPNAVIDPLCAFTKVLLTCSNATLPPDKLDTSTLAIVTAPAANVLAASPAAATFAPVIAASAIAAVPTDLAANVLAPNQLAATLAAVTDASANAAVPNPPEAILAAVTV